VKHDELGVFAFIEMVDEQGVTRMALTPKVVAELNRQQEALTPRARSTAGEGIGEAAQGCGDAARIHEEKVKCRFDR
jgi:hypothetical protein